jgi:hypothetical protein
MKQTKHIRVYEMWRANRQNSLPVDHRAVMTCITYLVSGSHDRLKSFGTGNILHGPLITYSCWTRHSWPQVLREVTRYKQIFSTLALTGNRRYNDLLLHTFVGHEIYEVSYNMQLEFSLKTMNCCFQEQALILPVGMSECTHLLEVTVQQIGKVSFFYRYNRSI